MSKPKLLIQGISDREALKEHLLHRKKLIIIKPRIDNRPPKAMSHIKQKAKRYFEELKRQADIQQINQMLLKKITKIEKGTSKLVSPHKTLNGFLNHSRLEELIRISGENQKILTRIESAKTHYSSKQQEDAYAHSQYLVMKLSENSRRLPRAMSYCRTERM